MASEMPPPPDRRVVRWPDGVQWIRQITAVAVVLVVWSGLFYGAMNLPGAGDGREAAADARRDARRAAALAASDSAGDASVEATTDEGAESRPAATDPEPPARRAEIAPGEASPAPDAAVAPPTRSAVAEPALDPETEFAPASTPAPTNETAADVPMEEVSLDPLEEASLDRPQDAAPDPLEEAVAAEEELGAVSFAADVLPVFERRCIKCHGGLRDDGTQRLEEGLSLLTVDDALAGSTWGSVIEPGDVAGSYLYELVESGDMPENEPRLLPRELRVIAAWIRAGAPNN